MTSSGGGFGVVSEEDFSARKDWLSIILIGKTRLGGYLSVWYLARHFSRCLVMAQMWKKFSQFSHCKYISINNNINIIIIITSECLGG